MVELRLVESTRTTKLLLPKNYHYTVVKNRFYYIRKKLGVETGNESRHLYAVHQLHQNIQTLGMHNIYEKV